MSPDTETPPRPPRRRLRYFIVIAGLLLVVVALVGIKFAQIQTLIGFGKRAAAAGPPPELVSTDLAQSTAWEATLSAVGSVSGKESVVVSNDAPGRVSRLRFESGAKVKRGDILVELDAAPERASLASAIARRDNAELTASRSRRLVETNALPKAQLDADDAQLKSAVADAAALQAQIDRKIVRAPFDGHLGIRAVNLGQYLGPGTTITTLDSDEELLVDFSLPQERLAVVKTGMPVRITVNGASDTLAGAITAIDPTIDSSSRNIKLRASVENGQTRLRPGMFVTVAVVLPEKPAIVTVPATSIVHAPYGDSVFVIEDKKPGSPGITALPDGRPVKVARQQFVRVGASRGDFVAVAQGVKAGQSVVSAGAFKLRNDAPVVIDNKLKPRAQLEPRPENR
jgi:membrane fusion protein (multidrug efflux system)